MQEKEVYRAAAVRVKAPASLSNLGPGFDAFGLCIEGIGDEVVATRKVEPGIEVEGLEGFANGIPNDAKNIAAVGARLVLERSRRDGGIRLRIRKGIRIGSGIGGSAASAVAGTVAANELLGRPLSNDEVVLAALDAEQSAAGSVHGDNVLPCILGGFVLTTPGSPMTYRRYAVSGDLHLALLLPDFTILTENARASLPREVPLMDAALTAAAAAHVVASLLDEDWKAFGAAVMTDRLVEPHRALRMDFYASVKDAALDAGAFGCALSGSGPAMFAVTDSFSLADQVADAMLEALKRNGTAGESRVVRPGNGGVQVHPLKQDGGVR